MRPGSAGREVDVDAATARLRTLVLSADRTAPQPLPLRTVEPPLTTAQAQAARVRTLLGTFTTAFQAGQPRATNIRRIAALVDGAYVPPGEVLSLNRVAGRRTAARGFVADGAIVDGVLTDEVGGGVSQFATTLFNAAFFAGLPIPEHKPHSFYISRYPAGRESTVYYDAIDVKVRNDTAAGLLVRTRSTAGSVTVEDPTATTADAGSCRPPARGGPVPTAASTSPSPARSAAVTAAASAGCSARPTSRCRPTSGSPASPPWARSGVVRRRQPDVRVLDDAQHRPARLEHRGDPDAATDLAHGLPRRRAGVEEPGERRVGVGHAPVDDRSGRRVAARHERRARTRRRRSRRSRARRSTARCRAAR